jgi:hypothetical protein
LAGTEYYCLLALNSRSPRIQAGQRLPVVEPVSENYPPAGRPAAGDIFVVPHPCKPPDELRTSLFSARPHAGCWARPEKKSKLRRLQDKTTVRAHANVCISTGRPTEPAYVDYVLVGPPLFYLAVIVLLLVRTRRRTDLKPRNRVARAEAENVPILSCSFVGSRRPQGQRRGEEREVGWMAKFTRSSSKVIITFF